ncbi:phosphate ABC transporter permease PstA [Hafnia sp. HMSC23F03]|uniref:phosphate ABC transporter permease PstA n=1 Tax=Hafnia sp. HMSC23F03 TaxID=1581059 RepID=UPI0008A5FD07|nr:phosphate ABC transporter permease PstA [Hafnia sp. HMSC23F03]OFS07811.1 phosphate ABC transporter, permease protein PstA [Hafnia sp. HMSC23F03]
MSTQGPVQNATKTPWMRSGRPWIWLSAGAVTISLLALIGLIVLLAGQGMRYFWPHSVYEFELKSGQHIIGERYGITQVPRQQLLDAGVKLAPNAPAQLSRFLIKIGNREWQNQDFLVVMAEDINHTRKPKELLVLEREHNGNAYGYLVGLLENGQPLVGREIVRDLERRIARTKELSQKIAHLRQHQLSAISAQFESLRLTQRQAEMKGKWDARLQAQVKAERQELERKHQQLIARIDALGREQKSDSVLLRDMNGVQREIPIYEIHDAWQPNAMSTGDKVRHWAKQIKKFLVDSPRESNTEGGVFPAIFGTMLMVILMSVIVMPLGVIAAVYLHEYARKNWFTRLIRIAVVNLAGVPSIVYGIFGLGFFVYVLGGSIDQLLFSESLPNPTFGTPGLLWASLTLALLTLPVVIVSTEEGLARIPASLRQGSLALGATKAETLRRVVLPLAVPAMLTGLILAIARAAGETAPLMLVGVVKSAPELPIDSVFPYLHLDRKFMHLGFQVYDGALQSPNVEAARPLVFATAFLLVTLVVGLNLAAMSIRHYLREKYRALSL